jgi:hypothetical protein
MTTVPDRRFTGGLEVTQNAHLPTARTHATTTMNAHLPGDLLAVDHSDAFDRQSGTGCVGDL